MEVAVDDAAAAAAPPGAAVADSAASVTNPIKRRIDKLVASKLHNDPVGVALKNPFGRLRKHVL